MLLSAPALRCCSSWSSSWSARRPTGRNRGSSRVSSLRTRVMIELRARDDSFEPRIESRMRTDSSAAENPVEIVLRVR